MPTESVVLLPFVYAAVIAVVHFFGEEIDQRLDEYSGHVTSLATGATIAYLFLQLLPELYRGGREVGDGVFIMALAGFSAFHLAERWIVHHDAGVEQLRKDLQELHSVFLFSYYAAIGMILQYLHTIRVREALLLFIPVMAHTTVSSLTLQELHEDVVDSVLVRGGVSLAALLGVSLAFFAPVPAWAFHGLLAAVTGGFLYVVIHDHLSLEGDTRAYVLGLVLYGIVIILSWWLV